MHGIGIWIWMGRRFTTTSSRLTLQFLEAFCGVNRPPSMAKQIQLWFQIDDKEHSAVQINKFSYEIYVDLPNCILLQFDIKKNNIIFWYRKCHVEIFCWHRQFLFLLSVITIKKLHFKISKQTLASIYALGENFGKCPMPSKKQVLLGRTW